MLHVVVAVKSSGREGTVLSVHGSQEEAQAARAKVKPTWKAAALDWTELAAFTAMTIAAMPVRSKGAAAVRPSRGDLLDLGHENGIGLVALAAGPAVG